MCEICYAQFPEFYVIYRPPHQRDHYRLIPTASSAKEAVEHFLVISRKPRHLISAVMVLKNFKESSVVPIKRLRSARI